MKNTKIILIHEFLTTIRRPSFVVSLLIFPVILAVVVVVLSFTGSADSEAMVLLTGNDHTQQEGYVDESGLIKKLPPTIEPEELTHFPDQDSARNALVNGTITAYYLVPKDFIQSGNISYVRADYNPLSGLETSIVFRDVLDFNLLGQDPALADRYWSPMDVEEINLQATNRRDVNDPLSFLIPYFIGMILYVVIISSASLMLGSIATEKQNRVMELLMVSSSPSSILTGKIIALGLVGLFQTLVWAACSLFILRWVNQDSNMPGVFTIPPELIMWVVVYFLLGYAIYASLMAGVGALVPGMKEASQATMLVVMPLLIPLILSPSLSATPDNILSVVLSMIPFTAPVSMITRLSAGTVPLWHLAVSISLMILTAGLIIKGVAGLFRAQSLLTGQQFNIIRFMKALLG